MDNFAFDKDFEKNERTGIGEYFKLLMQEEERGADAIRQLANQKYFFLSFASLHTKKNIGCCVIELETAGQDVMTMVNAKCQVLGILPKECHSIRCFPLTDEGFTEQGMELNRVYSAAEIDRMGFGKV